MNGEKLLHGSLKLSLLLALGGATDDSKVHQKKGDVKPLHHSFYVFSLYAFRTHSTTIEHHSKYFYPGLYKWGVKMWKNFYIPFIHAF